MNKLEGIPNEQKEHDTTPGVFIMFLYSQHTINKYKNGKGFKQGIDIKTNDSMDKEAKNRTSYCSTI